MAIASWIVPVLWREGDSRTALERLAEELATLERSSQRSRAASELGAAFEYVEPDRRRAIAVYELAGHDAPRGLELAIELGWSLARARLTAAARASAIDEAEAWWDAGHPELCELALAAAGRDDERRVAAMRALLADRNLRDHAAAAETHARDVGEPEACVIAARFARAMRRSEDTVRWLEAALLAQPSHPIAASMLLHLAVQSREPEPLQRYLRLRLSGLDTTSWLDAMRGCALALVDTGHHRGLGLRTLRHTLERGYALGADIPGHLAMWVALARRATADGTRRELLPLVVAALDASRAPVDRVWLAAFATEVSLRDADNPVVAGAYAEIVAEHAPEHPIVRELVSAVARSTGVLSLPSEAVRAATRVLSEAPVDVDVDLDDLYAVATEAAILDDDDVAELLEDNDLAAVIASANAASTIPPGKLEPIKLPLTEPPDDVLPVEIDPPTVRAVSPAAQILQTLAKHGRATAATKSPIAIPRITNLPSLGSIPTPPSPPSARSAPVLTALRTPNRPTIPPRAPEPDNARERARRIAIPIDVRLVFADGVRIATHSRDISTSGLFVLATAEIAIGTELEVELLLPGREAFTEDEYRCSARVIRRDDGGYGLALLAPAAELVAALAAL